MRGRLLPIFLLLLAATSILPSPPAVHAQSLAPTTTRVPASNEAWTDTGIDLRTGDSLSVSASGLAGWNPRVQLGPDGSRVETCDVTVPQAPLGALVGRVGERTPVVVGASATLAGPGRVALLYNDCPGQYFDNAGGFDVRLVISPAVPAATPAIVVEPVLAAEPATGSGGMAFRTPLTVGALLLMACALAYLIAGRRRLRLAGAELEAPPTYMPAEPVPLPVPPGAARPTVTPAVLRIRGGPLAGREVPVADEPVTIGTAPDCTVVLPDDSLGVEGQHARIWQRDGRYMLHRLARRGALTLGDEPVQWAVLEPDDQFVVGPHQFSFQVR